MHAADGPFVSLAVLCERAVQNPDGTLTLTRVLDQLSMSNGPAALPATVTITAVIAVRTAGVRGSHVLQLIAREPSGASGEVASFQLELSPARPNIAQILPLHLTIHQPGEYWFDVRWDKRLLSRMRLLVESHTPQ